MAPRNDLQAGLKLHTVSTIYLEVSVEAVSLAGMKSRVKRRRRQLRSALEECCHVALDGAGRVMSCVPRFDGSARSSPR